MVSKIELLDHIYTYIRTTRQDPPTRQGLTDYLQRELGMPYSSIRRNFASLKKDLSTIQNILAENGQGEHLRHS